jgi:hypothetical protein
MALVCWRVAAGGISAHQSQETSVLMGIPLWLAYGAMVPGFALCAVIGASDVARHWRAAEGA